MDKDADLAGKISCRPCCSGRGAWWLCLIAGLATSLGWSQSRADNASYGYHLRGDGSARRQEGTVRTPVSAKFTLVSMTGFKLRYPQDHSAPLYLMFFLPSTGAAYVRAAEIQPSKSYLMTVLQERWDAGEVAFGPWPTGDVLVPLGIESDNLGIVATASRDPSASGEIYPVIVADTIKPPPIGQYEVVVRSDTGLAPLAWAVHAVASGRKQRVASGSIPRVVAGQAARIALDSATWPDGLYEIDFKGDLLSGGETIAVRKQYRFVHRSRPDPGVLPHG